MRARAIFNVASTQPYMHVVSHVALYVCNRAISAQ